MASFPLHSFKQPPHSLITVSFYLSFSHPSAAHPPCGKINQCFIIKAAQNFIYFFNEQVNDEHI